MNSPVLSILEVSRELPPPPQLLLFKVGYAPDLWYKNSKIVATHRLTQTLGPVLPGVSPRRSQAGLYPEKHLNCLVAFYQIH